MSIAFEKKLFLLGTAALAAVFAYYCGVRLLLWTALAALIHEGGHIAAALCAGGRLRSLSPSGAGLLLRYNQPRGYAADFFIAAAGPLVNLICAAAAGAGVRQGFFDASVSVFGELSLITGLFNLVPAAPLDGGAMLMAALSSRLELSRALAVTRAVTLACGLILVLLGIYTAVKTRYNISILAAGALIIGGLYAKGA